MSSKGLSTSAWIGIIIIIIVIIGAGWWAATRHGAPTTTTTTTPTGTSTTSTSPTTTTTTTTSSITGTATTTTTTTMMQGYTFIPPKPGYAAVIETSNAFVVVGPTGSKVPQFDNKGKQIIVVKFKANESATLPAENSTAFVNIDPGFYRNSYADALMMAGRQEPNPALRTQMYEAVYKLSNYYEPMIWLGQYIAVFNYWSWVHGRYYQPTLGERFDLITEDSNAPNIPLGIGNYANNATTYVDVTIGWPQSFDPAKSYETFGWLIFHEIGDTLVTYWKNQTEVLSPDLAVAWAHNKDGTDWYFVIRGNVKAYDPWHNNVYPVNATDVLFTLWRIARLNLDPSWMITSFINVNQSTVLTENELSSVLSKGGIYTSYGNFQGEVKSLSQLLQVYDYSGSTAGVVELKLYKPYGAILEILADPFTMVVPMKYMFDYTPQLQGKYTQALKDSNYGRSPSAWAKYVGTGEQEPTHQLLHKYPVGTGPYYVKEYKENSYIVLQYNPYYWNVTLWKQLYGTNAPEHKTAIFLINNDAVTRIEILKRGQADYGAIPMDRLKDVEGYQYSGTNYKVVVKNLGLDPTILYIVLNDLKPPLDNLYVRQALAYAVPYTQIYNLVYAGYATELYGVLPAGFIGHNDNIVAKYSFNLTKAKELLQKSGVDLSKYSIEVWYNTGNSQREKIATLLQNTWGSLGLKVTAKALNWPTLLQNTEKPSFDVYIIGWAPDYIDPDDYAGPLFYGGTQFSVLQWTTVNSVSSAGSYLSG
ncbi:MAG: ABC transporter substrate-binding protein [Desulfurococcales archaeon]|nr:ABC transporter substrate-binding protein [Desulfurococcales archaeon]